LLAESEVLDDQSRPALEAFLRRCFALDPLDRPTADALSGDAWLREDGATGSPAFNFVALDVEPESAEDAVPASEAPIRGGTLLDSLLSIE
jgi:hypothetical protein